MPALLVGESQTIVEVLQDVARSKSRITYSGLVKRTKLQIDLANPRDRERLSKALGHIFEYELERKRPILCALVVRETLGIPGNGFFEMVDQHGLRKPLEDNLSVFIRLLNDVHTFYQRPHA